MNAYNGFSPNQRNKAQAWLNTQWRSGALQRPQQCCACGQAHGILDAHAEDYSEPFAAGKTDEFHLCFRCHMMVHCRYRNWAAWERYKQAIASGVRFKPFYARSFPKFAQQHLDNWAPEIEIETGEPPLRDILSEIEIYGKTRLGRAQGRVHDGQPVATGVRG